MAEEKKTGSGPEEEKPARESINFIHSIIERDIRDHVYDREITSIHFLLL